MKKLLPILALVSAAFSLAGCGTAIAVNNSDNPSAQYSLGAFTTSYVSKSPEYINNVFNATNLALDQLHYYRTGETPGKDKVTVFARARGDIQITVDIVKKVVENKDGSKQEWIDVTVRYGSWGNAEVCQGIVAKISDNLGVGLK